MALDHHRLKGSEQLGQLKQIAGRNGLGVEEVAGIVELDVPRRRQLTQGEPDLGRDGAIGHALVGGVTPQIAHQTAERTLAVGQKHRGDVFNRAVPGPLRLHEESMRPPRIGRQLGPR